MGSQGQSQRPSVPERDSPSCAHGAWKPGSGSRAGRPQVCSRLVNTRPTVHWSGKCPHLGLVSVRVLAGQVPDDLLSASLAGAPGGETQQLAWMVPKSSAINGEKKKFYFILSIYRFIYLFYKVVGYRLAFPLLSCTFLLFLRRCSVLFSYLKKDVQETSPRASGWLSPLSVRLRPRSRSHGSRVRAPRRALC